MKNTSILIPIILIGCLAALIYLFYAALQATEDGGQNGENPIVLNPNDYSGDTPDDIGETTNLDSYFQPVPEGEKVDPRPTTDTPAIDDEVVIPPSGGSTEVPPATTTAPTSPPPTTTTAVNEGRYLVIAGSFRQLAGAEERVKALRSAGFTDTRMEKFNRGSL
ncbi:MAG: SPOR domain-containing protein, partial [Bacteroidota bacterium]